MQYPEGTANAAQFLKQCIPYMVDNNIPANPNNYALWYNYVADNIPALGAALKTMLDLKQGFSPEQSEKLYDRYILGLPVENHRNIVDTINQFAQQLISQLDVQLKDGAHFGRQLESNLSQLQQSTSMGEVTAVINQLMSATTDIHSANLDFQRSADAANVEITRLQKKLQVVEKQAYTDDLTQLYNRHAFNLQLEQLLQIDLVASKVCLIIADLDHFKAFNDNYGHIIGDRVLRRMGELIHDGCPDNAFGARFGGEEFAIIISNTDLTQAVEVAEQLRCELTKIRVRTKGSDKVLDNISASFGVAQFELGESMETFIDRSDQALYRAKHLGRNRVECFKPAVGPANATANAARKPPLNNNKLSL